jgi:hypothetical protein
MILAKKENIIVLPRGFKNINLLFGFPYPKCISLCIYHYRIISITNFILTKCTPDNNDLTKAEKKYCDNLILKKTQKKNLDVLEEQEETPIQFHAASTLNNTSNNDNSGQQQNNKRPNNNIYA